jgi:hypothetical protein
MRASLKCSKEESDLRTVLCSSEASNTKRRKIQKREEAEAFGGCASRATTKVSDKDEKEKRGTFRVLLGLFLSKQPEEESPVLCSPSTCDQDEDEEKDPPLC